MKNTFASWIRVVPALLGCMIVVAGATAQENYPLAENGAIPGMLPEYAQPQQMNPDVFYNMYPNTYTGATSAQMYVAPLPVPANVGHTYYTYQPLMPHEYMYAHQRVYYTPYATADAFYQGNPYRCNTGAAGGMNKTTVTWYSGGFHMGPSPFANLFGGNRSRAINGGQSGCNSCR